MGRGREGGGREAVGGERGREERGRGIEMGIGIGVMAVGGEETRGTRMGMGEESRGDVRLGLDD
jgi:hypothetical protein